MSSNYSFGDNAQIHADVFGGNKWETNIYLLRAATGRVDWQSYRDRKRAPYRFLDTYDLPDAGIFAGRTSDVERLEGEVLANRVVVLQGPVGVGKTSLLRAGLVPRLMAHGYLVLLARDYARPTEGLIAALSEAQQQLSVDLTGVADLAGLVAAAQRSLDRPVILILDHFESFFAQAGLTPEGRARFRAELAAFRQAEFRLPACLVLGVRQQSQGELTYFQAPPDNPAVPDIFHHVVSLDLLALRQAGEAALAPLRGLEPPMVFDPDFLNGRLLPDLVIPGLGEQAIDPPHLQIICKELYDAARAQGQQFIGMRLYEELGGKDGILGGYLSRALSEEFPDPERYDMARGLLKAMVSSTGEPVFLSIAEAAGRTGWPPEAVAGVLDALQRRSLLLARAPQAFSLAHPTMVQAVLRWFDPAEAELRAAQDTLEHAWHDWLAWDRLREGPQSAPEAHAAPLLDRARLRRIAASRAHLEATPAQRALLLASAVAAGGDPAPWVQVLAAGLRSDDDSARGILQRLQRGGAADQLGAAAIQTGKALGLGDFLATSASVVAANVLGRAALSAGPAATRHTAALALAALGPDAVSAALLRPGQPASGRHQGGARDGWRQAQVFAWLRAAGCTLPELPSGALRAAVAAGGLVLRFLSDWRAIAFEAAGAALGGALAYAARGAMMVLLSSRPTIQLGLYAFYVSLISAGLGAALGGIMFAVARFLSPEPRPGEKGRSPARWGGALAIGFVLGLAVGIPAELGYSYIAGLSPSPARLAFRYFVGGPLQGIGIAAGLALASQTGKPRPVIAAAAGAGITGLLIGVLSRLTHFEWLPNLLLQGTLLPALAQAAFFGLLLGAGLAGGWVQARRLWAHWQPTSGRAQMMPPV